MERDIAFPEFHPVWPARHALHARDDLAEAVEQPRLAPIGVHRVAHGDPLERDPHLVDLLDHRGIEGSDARSAIGRDIEDALGLKELDRFPDRHAAHLELPREVLLDDAL